MMDLWRRIGVMLYWLTWPLIYAYSAFSGPRTRVLIIQGDEALLVKNWLGAGGWSLPGGGIHQGEQPIHAAVREVKEELGITLSPSALHEHGLKKTKERGGMPSKYYLFSLELDDKPSLRLQANEIMDAQWMSLATIAIQKRGISAIIRDSVAAWRAR